MLTASVITPSETRLSAELLLNNPSIIDYPKSIKKTQIHLQHHCPSALNENNNLNMTATKNNHRNDATAQLYSLKRKRDININNSTDAVDSNLISTTALLPSCEEKENPLLILDSHEPDQELYSSPSKKQTFHQVHPSIEDETETSPSLTSASSIVSEPEVSSNIDCIMNGVKDDQFFTSTNSEVMYENTDHSPDLMDSGNITLISNNEMTKNVMDTQTLLSTLMPKSPKSMLQFALLKAMDIRYNLGSKHSAGAESASSSQAQQTRQSVDALSAEQNIIGQHLKIQSESSIFAMDPVSLKSKDQDSIVLICPITRQRILTCSEILKRKTPVTDFSKIEKAQTSLNQFRMKLRSDIAVLIDTQSATIKNLLPYFGTEPFRNHLIFYNKLVLKQSWLDFTNNQQQSLFLQEDGEEQEDQGTFDFEDFGDEHVEEDALADDEESPKIELSMITLPSTVV